MQIVCVASVFLVIASSMGNASVADTKSSTARARTVIFHHPSPHGVIRSFQVSEGLPPDVVPGLKAERVSAEPKAEAPEPPKPKKPGGKVIYLTFDDGPTVRYTKQVLDVLDEYGAKATFFELGEEARAHPELTRAIVARGHALGSHTWNHKDLRWLSRKKLNRQITRTSAALGKISGRPITCLRPPYGAVNGRVRSAIRKKDLAMILWDIDPRDWRRPGAARIARRVVSKAHNGAVSLMHDGGGNRAQSVRALRRILRTLSKKGYRFETLPRC